MYHIPLANRQLRHIMRMVAHRAKDNVETETKQQPLPYSIRLKVSLVGRGNNELLKLSSTRKIRVHFILLKLFIHSFSFRNYIRITTYLVLIKLLRQITLCSYLLKLIANTQFCSSYILQSTLVLKHRITSRWSLTQIFSFLWK